MIAGVDAPTPSHREESEAVRPRGNFFQNLILENFGIF